MNNTPTVEVLETRSGRSSNLERQRWHIRVGDDHYVVQAASGQRTRRTEVYPADQHGWQDRYDNPIVSLPVYDPEKGVRALLGHLNGGGQ